MKHVMWLFLVSCFASPTAELFRLDLYAIGNDEACTLWYTDSLKTVRISWKTLMMWMMVDDADSLDEMDDMDDVEEPRMVQTRKK